MGKIKTIFKDDLGAVNRCLRSYSSVYMVYDSNVAALTGEISKHVRASLPITVSERMKTVEEAVKIDRWLLEQNADRKALVLAVGGGVTIDLAGFAASIYKKGIAWACVPTSLLAQVNAAVTGRTGVNLGAEKDILGSLQKPDFAFICPKALETLPSRDYKAGVAELLKTFIISDDAAYEMTLNALHSNYQDTLAELVTTAAEFNAKMAGHGSEEKSVLNLGGIFCDAIESFQLSNAVAEPLSHGEALAVGLVMTARLSESRGYAREGLGDKIARDLEAIGLPTVPPCAEEDIQDIISRRKKTEGGRLNVVLIEKIGKVKLTRI